MAALISYSDQSFRAEVTDTGEGFRIWWTDYVANDWEETYPDLSAAVARLALLIGAVRADRSFTDGAAEWLASWTLFADLSLSAP